MNQGGKIRPVFFDFAFRKEVICIKREKVFEEEEKYLEKVEENIEDHILFLDKNPDFATGAFGEGLYGDVSRVKDRNANRKERQDFVMLSESPYMGRMDFAVEGAEQESLVAYIGERSIYLDNKFLVYDWRTPVGQRFYMKNELKFTHENYDYTLLLRRALFIKEKKLQDFENEYMSSAYYGKGKAAGARDMGTDVVTEPFLIRILNEKRRKKELTPIIVSMQEEQNNINRLPFEKDIIVQGCAGSGKTMVLLHRLSYLKFNNPQLNWERVKIITPNEMFSTHINALSERLELSKIEKITADRYYAGILSEYEEYVISRKVLPLAAKNKEKKLVRTKIFKNADKIQSERNIDGDFIAYIYSDDFVTKLEEAYGEVWAEFEQDVAYDRIDRINEKFGFNKNVTFDDNTYKKVDVYIQTISAILSGEASINEMIAQRTERKEAFEEKIERDFGHIERYSRERDTVKRAIVSKAKTLVARNLENKEPNTVKNHGRINYKTENLEWHLHLLGIPHDDIAGSYKAVTTLFDNIAAAKQRIEDNRENIKNLEKEIAELSLKVLSEEDCMSLEASRQALMSFDVNNIFAKAFEKALGDRYQVFEKIKNFEQYRFYFYAKIIFFYMMYGRIRVSDALLAIDEGQDISPAEYKMMSLVNSDVRFNIYGDTNQLIKINGTDDWQKLQRIKSFDMFELPINYRNTIQIADYTNKMLDMDTKAVGISGVKVENMDFEDLFYIDDDAAEKRVAVVCKDLKAPYMKRFVSAVKKSEHISVGKTESGKIALIDIEAAKGLEFDKVYAVPRDMTANEKYIAYTRALSHLVDVT